MQLHRPWLAPLLISVWALVQLVMTTLQPSLWAISRVSDTRLALLLGAAHLCLSVASGITFVGSCLLRPLPVRLCITALVACPWLLLRRLLTEPLEPINFDVHTGAGLPLFLLLLNGLAIAYFFRPAVRLFWSSRAADPSRGAP